MRSFFSLLYIFFIPTIVLGTHNVQSNISSMLSNQHLLQLVRRSTNFAINGVKRIPISSKTSTKVAAQKIVSTRKTGYSVEKPNISASVNNIRLEGGSIPSPRVIGSLQGRMRNIKKLGQKGSLRCQAYTTKIASKTAARVVRASQGIEGQRKHSRQNTTIKNLGKRDPGATPDPLKDESHSHGHAKVVLSPPLELEGERFDDMGLIDPKPELELDDVELELIMTTLQKNSKGNYPKPYGDDHQPDSYPRTKTRKLAASLAIQKMPVASVRALSRKAITHLSTDAVETWQWLAIDTYWTRHGPRAIADLDEQWRCNRWPHGAEPLKDPPPMDYPPWTSPWE